MPRNTINDGFNSAAEELLDDHVVRPGPDLRQVTIDTVSTVVAPVDFNLDDFAGGGFTYRGKPIADQPDLDRLHQSGQ
jgi:hypothetical protein